MREVSETGDYSILQAISFDQIVISEIVRRYSSPPIPSHPLPESPSPPLPLCSSLLAMTAKQTNRYIMIMCYHSMDFLCLIAIDDNDLKKVQIDYNIIVILRDTFWTRDLNGKMEDR